MGMMAAILINLICLTK